MWIKLHFELDSENQKPLELNIGCVGMDWNYNYKHFYEISACVDN